MYQPKFKEGDKVFFILDDKLQSAPVLEVQPKGEDEDGHRFAYLVFAKSSQSMGQLCECVVFATPQEALDDLMDHYNNQKDEFEANDPIGKLALDLLSKMKEQNPDLN